MLKSIIYFYICIIFYSYILHIFIFMLFYITLYLRAYVVILPNNLLNSLIDLYNLQILLNFP